MPLPDFPVDDATAATAWLADVSHYDFTEWTSIPPDESERWMGLEAALSAVTQLKPAQLMKRTKKIVGQHLSGVDTKLWVVPEKKKEMAEEAVADILSDHDAEWKDKSKEWLNGALTVFMPRIIKLWKKTRNASHGNSDQGGSQINTSQKSSSTNAPKHRSRGAADLGPPEAKKVKTSTGNAEGKQKEEGVPASSATRFQRFRTISERLIRIQLDDDTSILIAPNAILKDKLLSWPAADLREEHLDYEKLRTLVESTCAKDLTLHWGKEGQPIGDEEDFIHAVGVMRFGLEKLCQEKG